MSWDTYVTNLLATKSVCHVAIIGHNGSIWAVSEGLQLQPGEVNAITNGFKSDSPLLASGVRFGGLKYFTLQANDKEIFGKKGNCGIAMYKTTQAIIIGVYPENV
ncbi:profilin, partial [Salmonella sp. s54395]|uniref:profilin n=1 Tax=Salmonella sp. s54395 TaxID=3159664 RepID=UPI0039807A07